MTSQLSLPLSSPLTPAQAHADDLLTALRAQMGPDGHTLLCGYWRERINGLECLGNCLIARQALAMAYPVADTREATR
jgi:hypothetical protein